MALTSTALADIQLRDAPVLMLDTCALLDVIRDITRKEVSAHNIEAALSMVQAAEAGRELVVLMADQVATELQDNLLNVEDGAKTALRKFLDQAKRINEVAAKFGGSGVLDTSHLTDHVARARAILDRLVRVALPVAASPGVPANAYHRIVHAIAPSQKGKDSAKDCLIIETYLETAAQLRSAGFKKPIVFGSTNTADYTDNGSHQVHSTLKPEFEARELEYGSNFGSMKHLLGL